MQGSAFSLRFDQSQHTVKISLTNHCAAAKRLVHLNITQTQYNDKEWNNCYKITV